MEGKKRKEEREMCVVLKVQRNRVLSRGRKKRDSQKAVFCHVQEQGEYKRYSRKKEKKEIILDSSVGRARGC